MTFAERVYAKDLRLPLTSAIDTNTVVIPHVKAGEMRQTQRVGWACAYWNPRLIKYIGWAVTDDPMDLTNYVPSAEALADKRVLFGCLPRPFNVLALFFNGLSLGCMWGVIFSFPFNVYAIEPVVEEGPSTVTSSPKIPSLYLSLLDVTRCQFTHLSRTLFDFFLTLEISVRLVPAMCSVSC